MWLVKLRNGLAGAVEVGMVNSTGVRCSNKAGTRREGVVVVCGADEIVNGGADAIPSRRSERAATRTCSNGFSGSSSCLYSMIWSSAVGVLATNVAMSLMMSVRDVGEGGRAASGTSSWSSAALNSAIRATHLEEHRSALERY